MKNYDIVIMAIGDPSPDTPTKILLFRINVNCTLFPAQVPNLLIEVSILDLFHRYTLFTRVCLKIPIFQLFSSLLDNPQAYSCSVHAKQNRVIIEC